MDKYLVSRHDDGSKRKYETDSNSQDQSVLKDQAIKKTRLDRTDVRKFKQMVNKVDTDLHLLDFNCSKTTKGGKNANFKVASWNVAGVRACTKKNGFYYLKKEDADIVCLQEVKCSESQLPREVYMKGYHRYWCSGTKAGYAGVALYSKEKPIKVIYGLGKPEYDTEGRVITAEYDKFYVVATYVPNAGDGLKNLLRRLQWDIDFRNYLKSLDENKPVILVGDLNVSHKEIDIANPKMNTKTAGFTEEERAGMTALLNDGFVDSFRQLYPDKTEAYTFWSYIGNARSKNIGWRLDYFVVSERFMDNVCDNVIRSEVYGSDHCPIVLYLNL